MSATATQEKTNLFQQLGEDYLPSHAVTATLEKIGDAKAPEGFNDRGEPKKYHVIPLTFKADGGPRQTVFFNLLVTPEFISGIDPRNLTDKGERFVYRNNISNPQATAAVQILAGDSIDEFSADLLDNLGDVDHFVATLRQYALNQRFGLFLVQKSEVIGEEEREDGSIKKVYARLSDYEAGGPSRGETAFWPADQYEALEKRARKSLESAHRRRDREVTKAEAAGETPPTGPIVPSFVIAWEEGLCPLG